MHPLQRDLWALVFIPLTGATMGACAWLFHAYASDLLVTLLTMAVVFAMAISSWEGTRMYWTSR